MKNPDYKNRSQLKSFSENINKVIAQNKTQSELHIIQVIM